MNVKLNGWEGRHNHQHGRVKLVTDATLAVEKDMERAMAAPQGHGATFGGRTRATALGDRSGRPGRKPEHTQALADNLEVEALVQQAQAVAEAAAVEGFISEGGL